MIQSGGSMVLGDDESPAVDVHRTSGRIETREPVRTDTPAPSSKAGRVSDQFLRSAGPSIGCPPGQTTVDRIVSVPVECTTEAPALAKTRARDSGG